MVNPTQAVTPIVVGRHVTTNGETLQEGKMNYDEFFEKALAGRSVNQAAKDWGIHQQTLDKWKKHKGLPDYDIAMLMALDAGLSPAEAMKVLARENAIRKQRAPVIAAILAAIAGVNFFVTPSPADASEHHTKQVENTWYYVKRRRQFLLRAIQAFRRLAPEPTAP